MFENIGIGPKEATPNERNFTEEQLREGNKIISLQYGTNKGNLFLAFFISIYSICANLFFIFKLTLLGATASGLNMGNTRHM